MLTIVSVTGQYSTHVCSVHLQDTFILQNRGETILEGSGSKYQDIKQINLVFGGNLDTERPI